jgi:hypothetical protein
MPGDWPEEFRIPETEVRNFDGLVKPLALKPGSVLFRVIGKDNNPAGAYWTTAMPPDLEAEWRASNAVPPSFNGGSCMEVYIVPKNTEIYVWEGLVAPQRESENAAFYLRGGGPQYWIPSAARQLKGERILYAPTPWSKAH